MVAKIDLNGRSADLDGLLDQVSAALDESLLPIALFNDPAIFEAELERIFARNWVFVAHETEIPKTGDYVLRKIGLEQVIVVRDNDGIVRVMSNHCRHRGTEVCQTDRGNARSFTCPYHGWVYKNNGDWLGAPRYQEAYGGKLDPKEWGLVHAPHVDSHLGFIFASLDVDAKPLAEALGPGRWLMDAMFGLHPDGMKVVGLPDRFQTRADWKSGAENFAGDTYHVSHLHFSLEKVGLIQDLGAAAHFGQSFEFGEGHAAAGIALGQAVPGFAYWGYPQSIVEQLDLSRLDEAQHKMVRDYAPLVGTIFPNLSFFRSIVSAGPDKPPLVATAIRQWQPLAPGLTELLSWQLVWPFMSEDEASEAYAAGQYFLGSGGVLEQDDTTVWEGAARAGSSKWLRRQGIKFHYQQQGPTVDRSSDDDWTGPGVHRSTTFGEHRQLSFYRHWLKMMRGN